MKKHLIFCLFCIICQLSYSQFLVRAIVRAGDTIPLMNLAPAAVYGVRVFRTAEDEKRFRRLVYNVKKVYPYAKKAGEKYVEYLKIIETQKRRGKQLKAMAPIEKELKKEYMSQLKGFTFTQGRILIKLMDRETNSTSYQLIKTFRGGFKAFWWQTIASSFNMSLKESYDPTGKDWEIEMIVRMIEDGYIDL